MNSPSQGSTAPAPPTFDGDTADDVGATLVSPDGVEVPAEVVVAAIPIPLRATDDVPALCITSRSAFLLPDDCGVNSTSS